MINEETFTPLKTLIGILQTWSLGLSNFTKGNEAFANEYSAIAFLIEEETERIESSLLTTKTPLMT